TVQGDEIYLKANPGNNGGSSMTFAVTFMTTDAHPAPSGGGDTGKRNLWGTGLINDVQWYADSTSVYLHRVGNIVGLQIDAYSRAGISATSTLVTLPEGFRPSMNQENRNPDGHRVSVLGGGAVNILPTSTLDDWSQLRYSITYLTTDPWPTTLPGTPA